MPIMKCSQWRIGSKIRLKWTVPWFSVFVDQTNVKIIWKFSLSQYRCHKTLIDVENCGKSTLNSNLRKQNFTAITNWGGGDYQLRSMLAAKHIWVAVITRWGTLDSPLAQLVNVCYLFFFCSSPLMGGFFLMLSPSARGEGKPHPYSFHSAIYSQT